MLNILSFRVVVKLVDAESSMYLMDFFYWLILSGALMPLDRAGVLFMALDAPG